MKNSRRFRFITPYISTQYKKSSFGGEPEDILVYTGIEMTDGSLTYSRYYNCKSVKSYGLEEKYRGSISDLYVIVRDLEISYIKDLAKRLATYWKEKDPSADIMLKNLKELPFQPGNLMTKRETELIIELFTINAMLENALHK